MDPALPSLSLPANAVSAFEAPAAGRTGKPRIWTTFAIWIVGALTGQITVIAAFVVVGIGMGFVMGVQGLDAATAQARLQAAFQQPLLMLLLTLVPFQLGMCAVALLAARWSQEPLKDRLGIVPQAGRTIGRLGQMALAGFTMSAALAAVLGSSLFMGQPPTNAIGAALSTGSMWSLTLVSIVLSLVPAIVEEIVFRGYIQRRLLRRWSPAAAIAVSTLLFALLHADSLQHIIAVIPLGIVTGLLAYRTNSIVPGMLVHSIHNAGVVGLAAFVRLVSPMIGDESVGMVVMGGIAVLSLAGLPAIIALLRRSQSEEVVTTQVVLSPLGSAASQAA